MCTCVDYFWKYLCWTMLLISMITWWTWNLYLWWICNLYDLYCIAIQLVNRWIVLAVQVENQLQSTMLSGMKETVVILSFLVVKLTLLVTVSGHQAVNPLKDAASLPHEHQHTHKPVQQQQQHGPAHPGTEHHHPARGIDRNAVHNQQ